MPSAMNYKINILSTRPLRQSLLDEAAANDIYIDTISFIHTEPINDPQLQQEISLLLDREIIAVFTSMNAVDAVTDNMRHRKPNWKVFCIGDATGNLVSRYFGEAAITGTAQSAGELADVIINSGVKELVFFCGNQRRPELPEKLAKNKISVKELTVYRTITTPTKIEKNYNGILFFSPSAVESFFSANTINSYTVLFAIGNTTGDTIRKFTGNAVITSNAPGKEELARNAIEYFIKVKSEK